MHTREQTVHLCVLHCAVSFGVTFNLEKKYKENDKNGWMENVKKNI